MNLPPISCPHPTPLDWYRAPVWFSWAIQQIPIGYLFYLWQCKLCQRLWQYGSPQTVENSSRDGNTRPLTLPASWEICMQVKKQQLEPDMEQQTGSKLGKEFISQGCRLSPCLFNLYVKYIMRNARLDEAQSGIKIARRNINNLR